MALLIFQCARWVGVRVWALAVVVPEVLGMRRAQGTEYLSLRKTKDMGRGFADTGSNLIFFSS